MKDSFMVKTLRYKIREILTKNQKEKSREIFRAIYWIGQYTKIAVNAYVSMHDDWWDS